MAGRRMAQPVYAQLRKYPSVPTLTLRANKRRATPDEGLTSTRKAHGLYPRFLGCHSATESTICQTS